VKGRFIADYDPNQTVDDVFLVRQKEIRPKKSGGEYLFIVLADKTGSLTAFMWDNVEIFRHRFDVDDFVHVLGVTKDYNRNLQITAHKIQRVDPDGVSLQDFIRCSPHDPDKAMAELVGLIQEHVDNPHLRLLLQNIFTDPEVQRRFKQCPAAKSLHHAYVGGLLDHTLSVMRLCRPICAHYPFLDQSLLLAGAALHDLGKLEELHWGKSIDYTDEGRLVGHITMEAIYLDRKIREVPDFPTALRMELLHLVVSHHRELEFGSPKRPKTLEALALSYLDDLDAKIQTFQEAIGQPGDSDGWTAFNPSLQRFIYRRRPSTPSPGDDTSE
jgi:3'-5' exoribonuclease